MECSINNPALSLLMKHLVIGQRLKTPNFSAFHWSPRGSLVSIGQHFVASRVVHLPKSTETSLISTESDQSGPNHQLLQLLTASTAWSRLCGPCIAVIAGLNLNHCVLTYQYPIIYLLRHKMVILLLFFRNNLGIQDSPTDQDFCDCFKRKLASGSSMTQDCF